MASNSQPTRAARPRPTPTPSQSTTGQAPPGTELVARAGGVLKFVEGYSTDFGRVMPKHTSVEAFMGLALAYVRRDQKLRDAAAVNPGSLILALRECAALGHTPVPKIYALVPFRSKDAPGGWAITGIETYHGVVERMFRAGAVQAVKSELVRQTDRFVWDPLQQAVAVHQYDPMADDAARGPLAGAYAWAVMASGIRSAMIWMNRAEVMKHKAVAKTTAFWDGPWEPDMWRKTVLLKLETVVPTSAEYLWNANASMAASTTGFAGVPEEAPSQFLLPDDTIYEAEVVPDTSPPAERESQGGPGSGGPGPRIPDADPPSDNIRPDTSGWPPTAQPPDANTDAGNTNDEAGKE